MAVSRRDSDYSFAVFLSFLLVVILTWHLADNTQGALLLLVVGCVTYCHTVYRQSILKFENEYREGLSYEGSCRHSF